MKILFADTFPSRFVDVLAERGHHCELRAELVAGDLPAAVGGYDALVVRSTRVNADTFAAADRLKLVIRAGAGTNTIDKPAAAARGIHVCNTPGRNALAVAELAMGLLLAVDRNIADNVADLRAGRWDKRRYAKAGGLYGRSVGVVGLGAIGMAFAERAHAFGMRVCIVNRAARSAEIEQRLARLDVMRFDALAELAAACDVLSLHIPVSEQTRHLVDRELLAGMRPGAIIINTARGELIDEAALVEAMDAKGIRAGLDVYMGEPGSGTGQFESVLARHPNVTGTHHIGASTEQAQDAVAEGVVEIIEAFADGRILNCVNQPPV